MEVAMGEAVFVQLFSRLQNGASNLLELVPHWLVITYLPPKLVYKLASVAFPRIAN